MPTEEGKPAYRNLRMRKTINGSDYLRLLLATTCLAFATTLFTLDPCAETPTVQSRLELRSSDRQLTAAFIWAKEQALSYANDGDPVGPWYEAALPGRQAFCMRDVSHQAAGAQALGLSRYTHNMLHQFAENISGSRDWCSYWEIDRLNRPALVDYVNDHSFWYNLPANFDVLDACYRMYLWTGDRSYVDDPVFLNFYHRTVKDYVSRWDLDLEHIMTRVSRPQEGSFFRGDPSYEESRRDIALGSDLLAAQYAAYRSYAAFASISGDLSTAKQYMELAAEVKLLINTKWWNPEENDFYGFLDNKHQFLGHAGVDLLYWDAIDDDPRIKTSVDALLRKMRGEPDKEVEPESHYAEILYRYGESDAAYSEVLDLSRPGRQRREYPEVSYSVIGAIVNGLMGINVEPTMPLEELTSGKQFETVVSTLSQLSAPTAWAEMRNVPIGNAFIDVRHNGRRMTVLTNRGSSTMDWQASFSGTFATLKVNGKPRTAHPGMLPPGRAVTWVMVKVRPQGRIRVEVPN